MWRIFKRSIGQHDLSETLCSREDSSFQNLAFMRTGHWQSFFQNCKQLECELKSYKIAYRTCAQDRRTIVV